MGSIQPYPDIHATPCEYCGAESGQPCVVRGTGRVKKDGVHIRRWERGVDAVGEWWDSLRARCHGCEHYSKPHLCAVHTHIRQKECLDHTRP